MRVFVQLKPACTVSLPSSYGFIQVNTNQDQLIFDRDLVLTLVWALTPAVCLALGHSLPEYKVFSCSSAAVTVSGR